MAGLQVPVAAAPALPSILPSPPSKSLRPIAVPGLSSSKKPALGGGGRWRSLSRRPVVLRVGVSGPGKVAEMVRAPDGFVDGDVGEEEGGGGSGKAEAVVLGIGSLEVEVDSASGGLELEATLNEMSKWMVAALFGIVVLWKHDAEIMWIAMGSVINAWLSTQLKQIFNHQRPDPALRSDPGMPSSHAQSIFYALTFVVLLFFNSLGINPLTVSIGAFTLACGSYLVRRQTCVHVLVCLKCDFFPLLADI